MGRNHKNQGLAVGFILIAVTLITAIVAAFSQSSSQFQSDATPEKVMLSASRIMEEAAKIYTATERAEATQLDVDTFLSSYVDGNMQIFAEATTENTNWQIGKVIIDGEERTVLIASNLKHDVAKRLQKIIYSIETASAPGAGNVVQFGL